MKRLKYPLFLLLTLLVGCKGKSSEVPSLSETESSDISASSSVVENSSVSESSLVRDGFPDTPVGIDVPDSVFDYYVNVNFDLIGNALRGELYNKVTGHTELPYSALPDVMKTTDRDWNLSPDANDTNPYMVLIYGTYNFKTSSAKRHSTYDDDVWDREHIWAKSHGKFENNAPAGTDLHHLRSSDKKNNSSRGNLDFGDTASSPSVKDYDGVASGSRGPSSSKSGQVYEPMDIYKGDVARAMFYMATRYSSFNTTGGNQHRNLDLVDHTTGTSTGNGRFGIVSDLLKWHLEDPVDEFEFNRNGLVQDVQHNRNPYIDFPELAHKVFG